MNGKLQGRVAIVSGSGRGIGRAVALKLASEGACVVVNDLEAVHAEAVVAEIEQAGGQASACVGSVTDEAFAAQFVGHAMERFGALDIVVNNAGYTWDSVIHKMEDAQWEAMLQVHLTAPFRILRAAAAPLREQAKRDAAEGRRVVRKVVNVSSLSGVCGNAGQVNYAAAKAGINGITRTLAKEWGRHQITVNSVAFGLIKTRLTEATADGNASISMDGRDIPVGVNPELMRSFEQSIPLGRAGLPEDAANAIYLMCAPESDYITGHVLVCSGGYLF